MQALEGRRVRAEGDLTPPEIRMREHQYLLRGWKVNLCATKEKRSTAPRELRQMRA